MGSYDDSSSGSDIFWLILAMALGFGSTWLFTLLGSAVLLLLYQGSPRGAVSEANSQGANGLYNGCLGLGIGSVGAFILAIASKGHPDRLYRLSLIIMAVAIAATSLCASVKHLVGLGRRLRGNRIGTK